MRLKPNPEPFKLSFGDRGEMVAWAEIARAGYRILEKNYRCAAGEIDCIAEKNGRIVFFEVKTRRSERFGRPEEAVHLLKQKKITRVAIWYLKAAHKTEAPAAFGVVSILWAEGKPPEVRIIDNAFEAGHES